MGIEVRSTPRSAMIDFPCARPEEELIQQSSRRSKGEVLVNLLLLSRSAVSRAQQARSQSSMHERAAVQPRQETQTHDRSENFPPTGRFAHDPCEVAPRITMRRRDGAGVAAEVERALASDNDGEERRESGYPPCERRVSQRRSDPRCCSCGERVPQAVIRIFCWRHRPDNCLCVSRGAEKVVRSSS